MNPMARKQDITVRQLAEETLVYDLVSNKAHCLNPTAALVWQNCDGKTPLARLTALVEKKLGIQPAGPVVELALEQLNRRHPLVETLNPLSDAARASRRDVLKKLAIAAAALPFIMTLTAKSARVAGASIGVPVGDCTVKDKKGAQTALQADGSSCTQPKPGKCCGGLCVTPAAAGTACTKGCQCTSGTCDAGGFCT